MFDDISQLIETSDVAFPHRGTAGVSDRAINEAEEQLSLKLPPSYKWWLREYGGGQIGGDIVYGLDEQELDVPDIVRLCKQNERQRGEEARKRLVFYVGNGVEFYFDTTAPDESEEYKVFEQEYGLPPRLYAGSFAEFLRRRISEVIGG